MVLELPELARENQNWQIYHAHIINSTAAEGVVSHLSGAAPKPVNSRELEAWNVSNAVANHLAAIFGDHNPIAIELPVERSHQDEPLCEDSHPKSDGAYSVRTADIVEGIDVEGASAAAEIPENPPYAPDGLSSADRSQEMEHSGRERNAHDPDHDTDLTSLAFKLKMTEFRNKTPSGTTPAGIPSIHNTNSTTIYSKDLGDPPNTPDGMSRGDNKETAENGGQWQRTAREVTRNDAMASPAPNLADRTSEMTTGNNPIPFSRTQPKKTVKHQHQSTRYIPLPNGCTNANTQHPKPKIHLPRQPRLPLEGERIGVAANGYTHSSSGQPMPQKLSTSSNKSDILITMSIESEDPGSSETITRICLGGVNCHANDPNGPRNQTDGSHGEADVSRGWTDTLNTSNRTATPGMSHRDDPSTYLDARDAKCNVDEMDRSHVDALGGHSDMPSVETDADTAAIAPAIVRTTRKRGKLPNLPSQSAKRLSDKPNSCRYHLDRSDGRMDMQNAGNKMETPSDEAETISMHQIEPKPPQPLTMGANGRANETDRSRHHPGTLNMRMHAVTPADEVGNISTHPNEQKWPNLPISATKQLPDETNSRRNPMETSGTRMDGHSITNDVKTAENTTEIIKTRPIKPTMQNSPNTAEITMPRHSYRWRKVSAGSINVYAPSNVQIVPPS
ncbi:hypothetical protein SCLCIDRAFT_27301 [Scleroderma citrinum Foug A]|uniref:Uncharacterized protein n=1 Tax=Scleroderma citrinum Foug A TaxID=1036808 RepID=A0A0C3DFI1_9AGAM|nr:hypothetical protein SCLCIDRAFT_27301 [Scleroderma citrinum Foug A]